ncbi:MAG TPA: VOC family protein [Acidimicrobiia bacterium]|jgi:catechol 2,3-dioxygenase-like lactoylglutathione lyase family enzyme|nr:VOC family protein [Acidimicrobiia bacterium]
MLLDGVNHVGMLTNDTDRLVAFYRDIFGCTSFVAEENDELKLTMINVGPDRELNVFEIKGNSEAQRQTPMFGRGRLDHVGLQAASREAFDEIRERLIKVGATDGFVTDFGKALSLFFVDPDGLEGEVLIPVPGSTHVNPPGTPAAGYERVR